MTKAKAKAVAYAAATALAMAILLVPAPKVQAELEVYDANGQFIGVMDYSSLGGDGHIVFIPALGVSVFIYDILEPGDVAFLSHILIDADDVPWGGYHSWLHVVCGKLYISSREFVRSIMLKAQLVYPCRVGFSLDPPRQDDGGFYHLDEISESDLPFTLPLAAPVEYRYVATSFGIKHKAPPPAGGK